MPQTPDSYLEVADAIGARLCRDAIWAGPRCNWLGPSMEPVSGMWRVVQRTFGPELYSGASGIALFLGRLYHLLPERVYRLTALGAIKLALSRVEDVPAMARISLYTGWAGIACACSTLSRLLGEEELGRQGARLLARLDDADLQGHGIDVLSGYAGAIPVLLLAAERDGQPGLRDLAVRLGDRLLGDARRGEFGWSWNTMAVPEAQRQQDLLGFSHGTAGIGWVLAELYRATGEPRFKEGTDQAFLYEQHWYSAEQGNWPDFRGLYEQMPGIPPGPGFMVAWCHGAPGVGLARLRAYQIFASDAYLRQAETAISTTARMLDQFATPGQGNYSLCHGVGGNADLLLYAAQLLDRPDLVAAARSVGDYGAREYHADQSPWPCGVMGAGETPGLFLGIAGIGYFYLRLHDPAETPPITILTSFD
jgi:lantibiotic modifying enzyme